MPGLLDGVLGGLSGGFGADPSSSTGQSDPFYNESGIYFQSPGSGVISNPVSDASATVTPRSQTGGVNALPYSQLPANTAAVANNGSSLYLLIFGGLLAVAGIAYFLFKGK